jgi:HD superfamily phosphodiesterase
VKKKADLEVLLPACLFHDVHSFNPGIAAGHDIASAAIAKKILLKVRFPKYKIAPVLNTITHHRSTASHDSLEARILQSIDKLDAFGPIGVYRMLVPLSVRGYEIDDIVRWIISEKKLEKKWRSISFPELKKKHMKDYKFSLKYFKTLAKFLDVRKEKTSFSEKRVYAT